MHIVMTLNPDNKIRIDKYIQENPDSKLNTSFPVSLKGVKKILEIYRLPTDMLFYNIRNGRFAAEYKDLVKKEGGSLRPEDTDDTVKIKKLLLELDKIETDRTYADLKIRGQWNCGIITQDGYMIDGNRRMSIISKLHDDTGEKKWKYLDVARLEESISAEDLWTLEAGIQLGKYEIVRYGPINELLKIREGVGAGMSVKTIANTLYGSDEGEINDKLDRLGLIEQYLQFMGVPEKYSEVKNKVEHFIDLQKIIAACKSRSYNPDKIIKIKRASFQLIKEGLQHLEIRQIHHMVNKDLTDAISEIETAGSQLKPALPQETNPDEIIEEETTYIINEFEEKNKELSPTHTYFINAKDILDVSNNDGKEFLLLNRAEKNLRPLLDYQGSELSTPEAVSIIKKIAKYAEELKNKFGD